MNSRVLSSTVAGLCTLWAVQAAAQGFVRPVPNDQNWFDGPAYVAAEPEPNQPSPSDVVPRQVGPEATQPSPSDVAPAAPPAVLEPFPWACPECGRTDGCNCGKRWWQRLTPRGGSTLADLGEPWKLLDGPWAQAAGIDAGGWVAQSFTCNVYGPADRYNGPVTGTDRSNDYQLNELYLYFGNPANTCGCGLDCGYRVDLLFGSNYRWCTAVGLETDWNSGSTYGLALPQAYAEVAYNNVTVKMGHFISPVGYYTVGTANNFFPFLPYTRQYGEPFTHFGLLATYQFNDRFSWGNGFVRGWDSLAPNNAPPGFVPGSPNLAYLTTMTYTRPNGSTLAFVALYGTEAAAFAPDGFAPRYLQTLAYTHKFSSDMTGVVQSEFGFQQDALAGGETGFWYGVNSYLYWNLTKRLQWGLNGEWFRDADGIRVGQLLPSAASPDARGWAPGTTFPGNFFACAIGPKFYFTPNVYTRAALRCDWYDGAGRPFDDGTRDHQELVVVDLVCTY